MSYSPAVERGIEMMRIPMRDLPEKALIMCRHMCDTYMMCMEVMLTAYVVYAQIEEGLECDDDLYRVDLCLQGEWELAQSRYRKSGPGGLGVVVRR